MQLLFNKMSLDRFYLDQFRLYVDAAVTTEIKSFLLNLLVSAAPPKVDHFCNAGNKSEFRLKVLLSSLAIWVIKYPREGYKITTLIFGHYYIL